MSKLPSCFLGARGIVGGHPFYGKQREMENTPPTVQAEPP